MDRAVTAAARLAAQLPSMGLRPARVIKRNRFPDGNKHVGTWETFVVGKPPVVHGARVDVFPPGGTMAQRPLSLGEMDKIKAAAKQIARDLGVRVLIERSGSAGAFTVFFATEIPARIVQSPSRHDPDVLVGAVPSSFDGTWLAIGGVGVLALLREILVE